MIATRLVRRVETRGWYTKSACADSESRLVTSSRFRRYSGPNSDGRSLSTGRGKQRAHSRLLPRHSALSTQYLALLVLLACLQACAFGQAPAAVSPAPQRIVELEADRIPKTVTKGDCLIRGGTVLTVTTGVVENGDVLVRGGRIAAIGRGLQAPAGVVTIDAAGKFVMPGIVDAHSHRGIDEVNEGSDSITAEVRIGDVLNPDSYAIYQALASGETSALTLHGSANPIGGQSIIIKMKYRRPPEELPIPDAPR